MNHIKLFEQHQEKKVIDFGKILYPAYIKYKEGETRFVDRILSNDNIIEETGGYLAFKYMVNAHIDPKLKELTDTYLMGLEEMDNPWKDHSHEHHNLYNPKDRWLGKDGVRLVRQDETNKWLRIKNNEIWSFFQSYFNHTHEVGSVVTDNHQKTSDFIQGILVMTYNCKVYTTAKTNAKYRR